MRVANMLLAILKIFFGIPILTVPFKGFDVFSALAGLGGLCLIFSAIVDIFRSLGSFLEKLESFRSQKTEP